MPVFIDGLIDVTAAFVADERWNGWLNPYFDRENAQKIIDVMNALPEENSAGTFFWDGDVVVQSDPEDEDGPDRIEPVLIERDGVTVMTWPIGAFGWVWSERRALPWGLDEEPI